jgi:hypothetical protein
VPPGCLAQARLLQQPIPLRQGNGGAVVLAPTRQPQPIVPSSGDDASDTQVLVSRLCESVSGRVNGL